MSDTHIDSVDFLYNINHYNVGRGIDKHTKVDLEKTQNKTRFVLLRE